MAVAIGNNNVARHAAMKRPSGPMQGAQSLPGRGRRAAWRVELSAHAADMPVTRGIGSAFPGVAGSLDTPLEFAAQPAKADVREDKAARNP
jgi:hypothetical protein